MNSKCYAYTLIAIALLQQPSVVFALPAEGTVPPPIKLTSSSLNSIVIPEQALSAVPQLTTTPGPSQIKLEPSAVGVAPGEPGVVEKLRKANETMTRIHLSPLSRQIAEKLDLLDTIIDLDELRSAPESDLPAQIKRLQLKQKLNETILLVTLQVRDVAARIDRQTIILNRQRYALEARRDKAGRLNSIANLISNGFMQEIGQAGEMKVNEIPGEELELVAGGLTIMLGAMALKQESGSAQRTTPKPNMLAKVFDQPTDGENDYPPIIWWYLNTAAPGTPSTDTRRADLMKRWRKFGVLAGTTKPADTVRAAMLSNTHKRQVLSIGLLSDQGVLLNEVKSEIYQLDHDLLQLMFGLQAL